MVMTKTVRQFLIFALIAGVVGCQEETIRVHRVPKPPVPAQRLIAVMIPLPETTWFLKIMGPASDVATDEGDFRHFVESISIGKDSGLEWKAPESWKKQPPGPMESAVYRTGQGVKVSISKLTSGQDLLANINRWRGQIGLKPADTPDVPNMTKPISVGEIASTWVDLINPGTKDA